MISDPATQMQRMPGLKHPVSVLPRPSRLSLGDAMHLREQLGGLLSRLSADREASERRQAEAGKRDPMKAVTGRTALDNAIASAQDLIGQVDALLANLQTDHGALDPAPVTIVRPTVPAPRRAALRNAAMSAAMSQFKALPVAART